MILYSTHLSAVVLRRVCHPPLLARLRYSPLILSAVVLRKACHPPLLVLLMGRYSQPARAPPSHSSRSMLPTWFSLRLYCGEPTSANALITKPLLTLLTLLTLLLTLLTLLLMLLMLLLTLLTLLL